MAAVSKHPSDMLVWLERVLESCEKKSQYRSCGKLFELFEKQYKDILYPKTNNSDNSYSIKFKILSDIHWDRYTKTIK